MYSSDDVSMRGLLPVTGEVYPVEELSPLGRDLGGVVKGELETHIRGQGHKVVLVVRGIHTADLNVCAKSHSSEVMCTL